MYTVLTSEIFNVWLDKLRNIHARSTIVRKLQQIQAGNLGDWKSVGGGISEIRINIGPGYRLYFTQRKMDIVFLLCAGDKSTQLQDIEKARSMANNLGEYP